jgi:two-component system chemotaxis response regulator CheY
MRVLVADDEKSVGNSLADLVRAANHDVVGVVGSGFEAIQAYARLHPDLVLMDYLMPKLNGATACRNIIARDPAAKVILVTGWTSSDCSIDTGALALLSKPLSLAHLQVKLDGIAQTIVRHDEVPLLPRYFWASAERCVA